VRSGKRVAFDVGKARIGVAVSDFHGILSSPRDFVKRSEQLDETINSLLALLEVETPIEVYIGLPVNLRNEHTESTADSIRVAQALSRVSDIPIRLIDERMSTRLASGALSNAGKSMKQQRGSIDSASAAVILESALQIERGGAVDIGTPVEEFLND
jgi:putative Holliday junction resolvase